MQDVVRQYALRADSAGSHGSQDGVGQKGDGLRVVEGRIEGRNGNAQDATQEERHAERRQFQRQDKNEGEREGKNDSQEELDDEGERHDIWKAFMKGRHHDDASEGRPGHDQVGKQDQVGPEQQPRGSDCKAAQGGDAGQLLGGESEKDNPTGGAVEPEDENGIWDYTHSKTYDDGRQGITAGLALHRITIIRTVHPI